MRIGSALWRARLRDGRSVEIRPAVPSDAGPVRTFLESLSADTRWLRYHSPMPVVRSWMVEAVVGSDHRRREALLALHAGRVVGIAEWGRESDDQPAADVAIVVADDFRRLGVGRELMRHLAADGRSRGISEFTASVLTENRPTVSLIQNVAPVRDTRFDGPVLDVRIPLATSA